jgi:hypothetical protein
VRPYPDEILRAIQTATMAHFGPEVQSTYGKAQLAFSMLLFGIAQRDYDGAVPDLIEENRRVRSLLADAATALGRLDRDDARGSRERIDALPAPTTSLRLSDLRTEQAALRKAIAELAPLIEPAADDASLVALREVRSAIFAYLLEDAKKRSVPILGA